jgi:hypothetical protein
MRTRSITLFSLACAGLMFSSVAIGQQSAPKQMVYPAKGQTPQQQATAESQCNSWAVHLWGNTPPNPPVAATAQPAPDPGSGPRVRGAAAGATVGAIGGNNVGNAAAKGAVAGGVVRRNQNRGAAAAQNEAAAQQQQAGAAAYSNARQACLEGRGYSVK